MLNIAIENSKKNKNLDENLIIYSKDINYFISIKNEKITSLVGIKYLDWDSKIFKKKIGLLSLHQGNLNDQILQKINKFCIDEKYECIFVKVKTQEYKNIHVLEKNGFNLMDNIITLKINLKEITINNVDSDYKSRILLESDLPDIIEIIDNLYKFGRFFEDQNLDNNDVNKLYKEWITNEIKDEHIDVIGIEYKNKLVGFISCKYNLSNLNHDKEGVISLVGINKSCQGLGIGKKIMNYVLYNFYNKGIKNIYVGTQINNVNALNFYISNGFRIKSSTNSFHKWFKN
ncbi:MAG: GNAT family N-acetyltransferase [Paeniclostridium sordellii]|uniref:GNAT family N-acetyltransferase n=1 Tax=Paraclostridium sordellii TaxID=1505 RepID=UPI0005DBB614|nr:GNAT family N-acetyltransferase [Paeniclostridium sordellii]MBS6025328.1 GNAT family N-acetyltransferase [Paeniclostridium sordellii]CEN94068.1 TDP-fucosamine acetyltransferase [[Clostridium] sordellii] [Paeniclostridium sordellii]CEN96069.1 TDP-fucosamine acetyltransferase [[Clostridium] sordellii] [Paeniclostridium sordellii]